MTDSPTTERRVEPERPPTAAPVTPTAPSRWTGGRIAMIVAGSLLTLMAVAAAVLGAYGLWLHTTQRSDGYVMTSSERFSTGSYALATRTLHISSDVPSALYGRGWLGEELPLPLSVHAEYLGELSANLDGLFGSSGFSGPGTG